MNTSNKIRKALVALVLAALLMCTMAFAESADTSADTSVQTEVVAVEETADEASLDFISGMKNIINDTGLANGSWQQYVMIAVSCLLLYLAIVKQFEPLLLLPIAFGMLLANLPLGGLMDEPVFKT